MGSILGWNNPLEKGLATHSGILAWEIPWTEEPGRPQLQRVGHNLATKQQQQICWMMKVKVKSLSRVPLFATPWTVAYQSPLSMGFFRQEYWSGLPFPSPGDLSSPGIEPGFPSIGGSALTSEPMKQLEITAIKIHHKNWGLSKENPMWKSLRNE